MNTKKQKYYLRHLEFICGFDSTDIENLTFEELEKLYLKHKI